ncbi:DUF6311 domain-containing protein [Aureimonas mangrovi]|uniref:DUF6311 domain-containing protein n=1 Tax=Aureimonas mangrovi TaxID=2758041 RepID=UPI00163D7946|nr:DUF6311 domain-containing protein [Aureimonas mangrovi]
MSHAMPAVSKGERSPVARASVILMGWAAFMIVTGGLILQPSNIGWMETGDGRQHLLGWLFYSRSEWAFPLGLNPAYGLDVSSALIYSDSLPILAIPLKALGTLFPDGGQYFGIWVLACFVLQACFAYKIAGFITADPILRVLIAGFAAFAPPMVWRLHGHISLVSHFLILAGFYLFLCSLTARRPLAFAVLLAAAAAIHSYLFVMVAAIWAASLLQSLWDKRVSFGAAAIEVALAIGLVVIVCWQVGYFSVDGGLQGGGYGLYRANLLTLIDPDGWSYVLKDILGRPGDYEGFNYLGLGILLLLAVSIPFAGRAARSIAHGLRRYPLPSLILLALALFAVTNDIGLASMTIAFPIPAQIDHLANIFRASGRMLWPAFYVITLAVLALAVTSFPRRTGIAVVAAALLVQIVDTSAGWSFRTRLTAEPRGTWETPMTDPFWAEAATVYRNARYVMPRNQAPQWDVIADYAARNGLGSGAFYLGRVDPHAQEAAEHRLLHALMTGRYESASLYFLEDGYAPLAAATLREGDLLSEVDGFFVVAPGWGHCGTCVQRPLPWAPEWLPVPVGLSANMLESANEGFLLYGWGPIEGHGAWSLGDRALLHFADPLPREFRIEFTARAFGPNAGEPFEMVVAGVSQTFLLDTEPTHVALRFEVPTDTATIEIRIPRPTSPRDLGINIDGRELGLGIIDFTISP